jgi:O-antigen/teichoic acid export membrane protein
MNTVQRIAKNTLALSLGSLATAILGFFSMMYAARYLSASGFGVLTFALAFAAIFNVFTDVGLSTLTIREVAKDKALAPKYLGNIVVLKILSSVIVFALVALIINLLGYPQETIRVVYLIALSCILDSFSLTLSSVFQAYERMEFVTIGSVLVAVLRLGGILLVIGQGGGIIALGYVYLSVSAVLLGYSVTILTLKFARLKTESDLSFWKSVLGQAWPFGLVAVFTTIYYWIGSVTLSLMQGEEAVGWYNAAFRVFLVLELIPTAYFSSVFPVMSKFFVSSQESLRFIYEKSIKHLIIIGVPIGAGITILADKVILLIFGAEFSPSVIALQILIWSMLFLFVSRVFGLLFNSLNKQVIVAKVTVSCALLNVLLNVVLIPRYSYIGASIATLTTEFVALAVVFVWSWRIGYGISITKLAGTTAKVLIAVVIMGGLVFYLRDLALWWLVPLSALLYFTVLYIIGGIDREDRLLLRQAVGKQRTTDILK